MVTNTKKNHPSTPQPPTSRKFWRNQGKTVGKTSSYANKKTRNAQNLTSFSKINSNKKPFKLLIHHHKMKMALVVINNKQQQEKNDKPEPKMKPKWNNRKNNRNLPHTNWSLHNRPPREIRNIIPELPAQNVPALPQSINPLVRQHRSHRCNKKPQSQTQTQTPD